MANDPWAVPSAPQTPKLTLAQKAKALVQHWQTGPVEKGIEEFAALPAEGVNAILGAPQRVIAQRIAQLKKNPRGVAETTAAPLLGPIALLDPRGREEAGNEVYAAFHPNDLGPEQAAESATGVNRLMTNDPRFRGKLQNFAVRTGFQTLTDPLTVASLGTVPAGEIGLRALGRAGTRALISPNELVRTTAKNMLTNVPERTGGFTEPEIAAVNTLRQRGITQARVAHTADEALLHKYRGPLAKGVVPDEVRQRLLREPYVFGTPEMRQQAVSFGYRPTTAERSTGPLGLLNYNLKANYDPHTGMMKPQQFEDLLLGHSERTKPPKAGFEEHQAGEAEPGTLYDRLSKRLSAGRNVVRHRSTAEAMQKHLGVGPEMANGLATDEEIGGWPIAKAISRAQVDALLSTGIPHMRNVGVGGYLSLGESGITDAVRLLITGSPANEVKRLEQGAASHFGIRTPGKYSPARLLPLGFRKATTGMLDRWDTALRVARLRQVDREMPKATEFEKLDRVNQDLGAYNLKPQYVKVLQSFVGANFPQWHNYIVPTMVTRALIRNPGRVERLARGEQNANDAFLGNAPYRVTLGGPVDEGASAAADVARILSMKYPTYFGGPSSLGPASYILHPPPGKTTLPERAVEIGSSFIPFGGVGLDTFLNPYKSPIPPLPRALGGLAGVYTQKRPPQSRSRTATPISQPTAVQANPNDPWGVSAPSSTASPRQIGKPPSDPWAVATPP